MARTHRIRPTDATPLGSADENRSDELEVIEPEIAVAMLRMSRFGRLVFAYEHWPVVVPVNYLFEDPTIVIRTDLGAKLSAAPFHAAAFEVDDVDPKRTWGWSVLVQGPAFDISSATDERSILLRSLTVEPWAPGSHDHWLTVTAVNISGRRFGRVPLLEAFRTEQPRLGLEVEQ